MSVIASQITSLAIVYSAVYSGADQRKHQSSASLAFVRGIHRRPVNYPHKWPVTRKMFPFDDVIMATFCQQNEHNAVIRGLFQYKDSVLLAWRSLCKKRQSHDRIIFIMGIETMSWHVLLYEFLCWYCFAWLRTGEQGTGICF